MDYEAMSERSFSLMVTHGHGPSKSEILPGLGPEFWLRSSEPEP
jgi:hypothetical protein